MGNSYDVTIIGGGLAGLTLACLLGQAGIAVAVIDRESPENLQKADERTTAVSYGSQKILAQAGIWDQLSDEPCAINTIDILDGDGSPLLLQFLHEEVEGNAFGWIVDNGDLRQAMMRCVGGLESVDHVAPANVADFEVGDREAVAVLESGERFSSSLVVGADGRRSFVREWMEVPVRQWSYKQQAIVFIIAHEKPHDHKAVEHFMAGGPFAILPMSDDAQGRHRSSIVLTEHQGGGSLMDLDEAEFAAHVNGLAPEFYGHIEVISKRMVYPLSLVHAGEYISERMVLVADAAHGIHPIAGQGLNLGFRDVACLVDILHNVKLEGRDLGGRELLEEYQRKRRPDNMAMVAMTDGLNRLFSNDLRSVRLLRKAGLKAVSKINPVKQFFMKRAMGDGA